MCFYAMKELKLDKELYLNIINWATPQYSINTIKKYGQIMKKVFKKYKVLNSDTLKKIIKTFKYQNQRAVLVMINRYCFENDIDFIINIPRIKKQPTKIPEILSIEEIKLMIKSAPKPYDLAIRCIFNIGAGLRISEIIKISFNDIRWVDWLNNKDSYGVAIIKSGKGSKDRVLNIPKKLMSDLYKFAEETGRLNEFRIPHGGMIFNFGINYMDYKPELRSMDIEKWKNEYVDKCYRWFRYNIMQKYCENALNKKLRVHTLRHSRSTYLLEEEGVPIEELKELLGHSSLNTTMLYLHVNPKRIFERIKDTREI